MTAAFMTKPKPEVPPLKMSRDASTRISSTLRTSTPRCRSAAATSAAGISFWKNHTSIGSVHPWV